MLKKADYVIHPPSGSNLPGSSVPNPYIFYPPNSLRKLIEEEKDKKELELIRSALKQWERIYVYPGYPWRKKSNMIRILANRLNRLSEVSGPHPENMPYYYDDEVPEGLESVMEGLKGLHDNENMVREDIPRQGIRPHVDIDISQGDFSAPRDPTLQNAVKTKGDGADPEGMENDISPPTGGDIDQWPDML